MAGRFVEPLLFDTSPRDPFVVTGVVLVLLIVAIAACLLPATRASRVDPLLRFVRNEGAAGLAELHREQRQFPAMRKKGYRRALKN